MDEQGYLMLIEDDEADLILRLKAERRAVMLPDQANDIPIPEAVQKCQDIADDHHRYFDGDAAVPFRMKPHVQSGGMLT